MIKPTIGRVVWFWPSVDFLNHRKAYGQKFLYDEAQPCVALVVKVFDDRLVNLAVFDHCGRSHEVTSCPLRQDGDEIHPGGSYCEWMPYQKGQAAKTEAAESQLQRLAGIGHQQVVPPASVIGA